MEKQVWLSEVNQIWRLFLAPDALLKINADNSQVDTVRESMIPGPTASTVPSPVPTVDLNIFHELYEEQRRLLAEQTMNAYDQYLLREKKGMRKILSFESVSDRLAHNNNNNKTKVQEAPRSVSNEDVHKNKN